MRPRKMARIASRSLARSGDLGLAPPAPTVCRSETVAHREHRGQAAFVSHDGAASRIAQQLRDLQPGIRIELLANEGCLPHCPCKLSHDAYIALANLDGRDLTHDLNCRAGCIRLLEEQPHRLLQSPFIRPEDVDLYLYHVDTIKLCGRTLGAGFLENVITAYRRRRYDGNLLDLLDATAWLAERLYVDNRMLSFDFAAMLAQCDNRCDQCGFCRELFTAIAHPLPLVIEDRRVRAD